MATKHAVTLTLKATGTLVDVWNRYDVTVDMLAPGQPFTFSFWRSKTARATWEVLQDEVKIGDRVEVAIDGAPQLVGVIERFHIPVRAGEASMVISGRDLAGPLITWDADPRIALRNTRLSDTLTAIAAPFGLAVVVTKAADMRTAHQGARPGGRGAGTEERAHVFPRARPHVGEKAWALIDEYCRLAGYFCWIGPDPSGRLALIVDTPVATGEPVYAFTRRLNDDGTVTNDSNLLDSDYEVQDQDVPSEVTVSSHARRGGGLPVRALSTVANGWRLDSERVSASAPPHPRYLESRRGRSPDAAAREGRHIIARANAKFESYVGNVQGHGQRLALQGDRQRLYAVNTPARVRDDLSRVAKDMLVHRVHFAGTENAQTTEVTMAPLGAITVESAAD